MHNSESVLVTTEWVAQNLNNPNIRIIESNEDQLLYSSGHIPGAVEVDWVADLNDPVRRDYLDREGFEKLMSRIGGTRETICVFYGDKSNWWACYAFWVFQLFGHTKAKIMDGGRLKWEQEGRKLVRDTPTYAPTQYNAQPRNDSQIRAFRDEVLQHISANRLLVDVRSPAEFRGEKLHMEGYPQEGSLRGGHIPGAKSIPWALATNEDGTFKSVELLEDLYVKSKGLPRDEEVVVYCRIGERSSHTWFVLKYLLGFENVRNYDGSWTEWGNLVGAPVEKGDEL